MKNKMQSLSFGEFDEKDFTQLLKYVNHVNKTHKVKALWVHPDYYAKIITHWHDRLLSSSKDKGLDKIDMISYTIDIQIVSGMSGDFCIVTEEMLK